MSIYDIPGNPYATNPEPPDPPQPRLHEEHYEPGWCWTCYMVHDEVKHLQLIYTVTTQYGPDDDGAEEDEHYSIECPRHGEHSNFGDGYLFAEHALAILERNAEPECNAWLREDTKWRAHVDAFTESVEDSKRSSL